MSSRAKVSLVSEDITLPPDEGLKKFVYSILEPLSTSVELQVISSLEDGRLGPGVQHLAANRMMVGRDLRDGLRAFDPDAVIYVPRAAGTRNAFIRAAILRRYVPHARQLMVSLQPRQYDTLARMLIRRWHPDVVAAQSDSARDELAKLGLHALALPSGVDTQTFHPVSAEEKTALRRKFDVPDDAFVVLHVGHFTRERNVLILGEIRERLRCEAMMVGSTSTVAHDGVESELRQAGVRVLTSYIERIEEVYGLADCYLFPVQKSGGAIEMPLSVLEAMATSIPVVSSPFDSLPQWLPAGEGLSYASDNEGLIEEVARIRNGQAQPKADAIAARMERFSWPAIGKLILESLDLAPKSSGMDDPPRPSASPHPEGVSASVGRE